jgi:hypothetical protein
MLSVEKTPTNVDECRRMSTMSLLWVFRTEPRSTGASERI